MRIAGAGLLRDNGCDPRRTWRTGRGLPIVTGLKLSPSAFRRGKHTATLAKAKAKKKVPTATTISFELSQAATVTLSFEKSRPGVTVGKRFVAESKRNAKGKRCSLWTSVRGGVTRAGHAGLDKIRFEGILDTKKSLPRGAYRLTLKASNSGGSVIAPNIPASRSAAEYAPSPRRERMAAAVPVGFRRPVPKRPRTR